MLESEDVHDLIDELGYTGKGNYFIFNDSPAISSYIYTLAAGPYAEFVNDSGFKVPMRILCRQTKADLADAPNKFKLIEESIKFFEEFFTCPFPFKKYD